MKTLAIATATLGLAFTASPAFADPAELPHQAISIAGLDLATPEGQRMLDRRIDRAAREVCQVDNIRTGTRIRSQEAQRCFAKARASAQQQVAVIIEDQRRGG
ncbi:UrcA family protein [uncultured Erythrobacter sp.]|uniref:UrcA family protein n=1 Tax=uncultured Erythrobacter sp. TaxID=263913 RepID=UPI002620A5C8|nr:UrcA family protein [uncultured Erythrobacter sp.]